MSEQLLDRAEVGASLEQVGCEGMSQGMRAHSLLEGDLTHSALKISPDTSIGQSPTATIGEERGTGILADAPNGEVRLDRHLRRPAERHQSFFSPFAQYSGEAASQVQFGKVQARQLGTANPRTVEKLDDRAGPEGAAVFVFDFSELREVGFLEPLRDLPVQLGGEQGSSWVLVENAFPAKIAEEGAQGGQLSGRGRLRHALAVKECQEGSNRQVVDRRGNPGWHLEIIQELLEVP